jgi:hypothetical protein
MAVCGDAAIGLPNRYLSSRRLRSRDATWDHLGRSSSPGDSMLGLTLFAELAAAVACGGLALTLAELAGLRTKLTVVAGGAAAGFFIGLATQLGMPLVALPVAVVAVAGLERWIDRISKAQNVTRQASPTA